MMTRLPVGIENFERIRTEDFYYVDKTGLIRDLLRNMAYVNLFTRPRRFGKTLNMSMLKYFFETGTDSRLFDGLVISEEKELCERYMGKFPVISISLKNVSGRNFETAKSMMCSAIGNEAMRFSYLEQSERLTERERQRYTAVVHLDAEGAFVMSDKILQDSLLILSQCLWKHYGQKAVILVDEYDVPLDKAYQAGYYDDMVELFRNLFGQAFKTNDSLFLAVLTGCLRVSKESIFTGLNNFSVYTVKDVQYNEYFGFTDREVREMLACYGGMEKYDAVREWYDGYRFGKVDVYCPWDVINYCHALKMDPAARPQNYWINTSGNDIIRKFIHGARESTKAEIERLVEGGSIRKKIRQELTYRELDAKADYLWSLLFTTGYLTQCGEAEEDGTMELAIPNREVRWIFVDQIQEWFEEEMAKDSRKLENFCRAFEENDTAAIEEGFNAYLSKTISIRDNNVRRTMKENFYHGILLGIFGNMDGWQVSSNAESGEGYSDISIEVAGREIGIVIELKYAENAGFDEACRAALQQILDRRYEETLVKDGMKTIYRYGIACYRKRCKVLAG